MKLILCFSAVVAGAVGAMPAGAQTAGAFMNNPAFRDPPPARCMSTLDMQRCAAHDLRVANAQMTARYASLLGRLQPAAQQKLLAEQRAWLKSRDRDCLPRGNSGGSMASLAIAQCWIKVAKARATTLGARLPQASTPTRLLPPAAFVGRWRGGEGTYLKISHQDTGFVIDNQWGLDANMRGKFIGKVTPAGLSFRRNGVTETLRPSKGNAINRSALAGKTDCLMVSRDEGYCRY
ncbi:lysozyme inhibitor LprI family protein [Sphingomonas sp. Leaf23]|uniref:lysozyme inhibitor LprI family protein n=1 Tax=Sphingomonas sp. Leaf23 TaxID=1735689 RepID=UPI000A52DCC0|nr:lysozyme inhibitor LprI family protein [Sphingomonas sp. Leaf23]